VLLHFARGALRRVEESNPSVTHNAPQNALVIREINPETSRAMDFRKDLVLMETGSSHRILRACVLSDGKINAPYVAAENVRVFFEEAFTNYEAGRQPFVLNEV
jgi:hypothetical protein